MPTNQNQSLETIEPFPRGAMVHFGHKLCCGLSHFFKDVRLVGSDEFELKDLNRQYELIEDFRIPRDDMKKRPGLLGKLTTAWLRMTVMLRFLLQYYQATSNIIKRKPDYIIVATVFRYPMMSFFLGRMKKKGIRCLQICHEFEMREKQKKLSSRLLFLSNKNVYKQFHAIFFLSQAQRDGFHAAYPQIEQRRLFVIPMGNAELFEELKSDEPAEEVAVRYGLDASRPAVLFFGRVRSDKGVEDLIEAVRLLNQNAGPNHVRPQLVIGGDTRRAFQASLQSQIDNAGLTDDAILFPEYIPGNEVWHLLDVSSVVAFPYRSGSQSAALQVAMACGKPVVVSSVGGIPEVIDHGTSGLVVPPNSPPELAEAISKILDSEDFGRQLGEAARHESVTTYSWKTVAGQMVDSLQTLQN